MLLHCRRVAVDDRRRAAGTAVDAGTVLALSICGDQFPAAVVHRRMSNQAVLARHRMTSAGGTSNARAAWPRSACAVARRWRVASRPATQVRWRTRSSLGRSCRPIASLRRASGSSHAALRAGLGLHGHPGRWTQRSAPNACPPAPASPSALPTGMSVAPLVDATCARRRVRAQIRLGQLVVGVDSRTVRHDHRPVDRLAPVGRRWSWSNRAPGCQVAADDRAAWSRAVAPGRCRSGRAQATAAWSISTVTESPNGLQAIVGTGHGSRGLGRSRARGADRLLRRTTCAPRAGS